MIAYPDYFNAFVVRDDFGVYHEVIHLRHFKGDLYNSCLYCVSDSWLCATGWYADMNDRELNYNLSTCYYDLPDPALFGEKRSPLKWME